MNELLYNFINQVEDVNKVKEMSVEEFTKLVKSNGLISEEDAKLLIESFKKISSKKDEDTTDSDQRKKKYREQHKQTKTKNVDKNEIIYEEKENEDNSIER